MEDFDHKHEYIRGVQCDQSKCYACATHRHRCKRLEKLDILHIEEKKAKELKESIKEFNYQFQLNKEKANE